MKVRSILLTGASGFIARSVHRMLADASHNVLTVDSLEPRVHKSLTGAQALDFHGHVSETPYTLCAQADTVIHLAAQVGVADSALDPLRYVRQNTLETTQFLATLTQALANGHRLDKLVVASSMSVYGDPLTERPISEQFGVHPASVYGLTKYDQEVLCTLWGAQHGVPVVALRFFNVYGPGQALHNPYTGVLANFANWLLRDEAPLVYEDGLQTRDFVYVEDVADAVVRTALQRGLSGVFNICTGQPTTILDVARTLAHALDKDIQPTVTHTMRVGDIRHCIGAPDAAYRAFEWYAPTSVPVGLKRYADYLRA